MNFPGGFGLLGVPRDEVLLEFGYGVVTGFLEPSLKPLVGFLDTVPPWPEYPETARFSCRHLSGSGDCSIYEERPRMCRQYPMDEACSFEGCTLEPANALRFVA
jgi:Fe-S-cluster containining protein